MFGIITLELSKFVWFGFCNQLFLRDGLTSIPNVFVYAVGGG